MIYFLRAGCRWTSGMHSPNLCIPSHFYFILFSTVALGSDRRMSATRDMQAYEWPP
ncbi:hypothetical protein CGRA01v4_01790 [Colletotrichum graminicola]|nr:hypothetical protein CGRA01v4_01790 [Colletotrichum graminicola]